VVSGCPGNKKAKYVWITNHITSCFILNVT